MADVQFHGLLEQAIAEIQFEGQARGDHSYAEALGHLAERGELEAVVDSIVAYAVRRKGRRLGAVTLAALMALEIGAKAEQIRARRAS